MPLPLVSMMTRLCSTPPQTLGTVRPACSATSMNCTGEEGVEATAGLTWAAAPSLHTGVVSLSSSELLSRNKLDPRKRRRGISIRFSDDKSRADDWTTCNVLNRSSRLHFRKWMRDNAYALLHRNDGVNRNAGKFVGTAAGPDYLKRVDPASLTEAEMNARIAGRHVTGAALRLIDLHHAFGRELENRADAVAV